MSALHSTRLVREPLVIAASISAILNGLPVTLFRPCAGTRYSRAQHGDQLPGIHLGHQDLVETAEQLAEIARQRPDVAEVDVRHVEAARARIADRAADGPVGRAPADDGEARRVRCPGRPSAAGCRWRCRGSCRGARRSCAGGWPARRRCCRCRSPSRCRRCGARGRACRAPPRRAPASSGRAGTGGSPRGRCGTSPGTAR